MADKRRRRSNAYVKSSNGPIIRFKVKIVFIIFLVILAICFFVYMTGANFGGSDTGSYTATWKEHSEAAVSDSSRNSSESSTETKETSDDESKESETEKKSIENPVPESEPMPQTYLTKCVFVGDSITVGLSDYQFLPMQNVIAEVGMNISKINTETMQTVYGECTVTDALAQADPPPENVYIMLGSNGIAWLDIDDMVQEYSKFVDSVHEILPDAEIYFIGIPPVTAAREYSDEPILNSDINSYNTKLLDLANSKKYHFVDLNSALKGSDGTFPVEDAADDGMHFNKSTYDKMLQFILSHVAK